MISDKCEIINDEVIRGPGIACWIYIIWIIISCLILSFQQIKTKAYISMVINIIISLLSSYYMYSMCYNCQGLKGFFILFLIRIFIIIIFLLSFLSLFNSIMKNLPRNTNRNTNLYIDINKKDKLRNKSRNKSRKKSKK